MTRHYSPPKRRSDFRADRRATAFVSYMEGFTMEQIARKMGVSKTRVWQYLADLAYIGARPRPRGRRPRPQPQPPPVVADRRPDGLDAIIRKMEKEAAKLPQAHRPWPLDSG